VGSRGAVAVVAGVLAVALTACTGDMSRPSPTALSPGKIASRTEQASARWPSSGQVWTRESGLGISVSHPTGWRVWHFVEAGSFTTALLFLSNQPVTAPCTTSRTSTGTQTSCRGLPKARLRSGGVLLGWFSNGFPVRRGYDVLAHTRGRPTVIDGRRAKIDTAPAHGVCKQDGGTLAITATIAQGSGAANMSMSACLSHPSAALRNQLLRSLRSVRV
jgi:hypothetical protein